MRNPLNQKVVQLKPSGIRKFFDIVSEMPDAISLGVGEPDFDTPWHIRDAGIKSLQQGKTFYTSNAGLMELRQAIAAYSKRRFGLEYDPASELLVTVGGSEAIDLAMRVLLDAGDEVIYPEPCFVSYLPCIALADGVPVPVRLREEDQFRLTPELLESVITPKTKVLLISYPNNPTGAIMGREDLEKLARVIIKHDLIVVSDEIYAELSYQGDHVCIASLPGMRERTIVINGFSKAFAMTGWRLGYAMAPALIMKQMIKLHQFAIMCAPTTAQYAAVEAMRHGEGDVVTMRDAYNQRRRFLVNALAEMGIPCFEPFGAFYAFPNISQFGMSSEAFATRLLEAEQVAVVPGNAFGEPGEGFVRISYACSLPDLREAMHRLSRFVQSLSRHTAL